jgi:hypothetical protein
VGEQVEVEIQSEREYQVALQTLGQRTRPNWLLRVIMNALERYRQSRKMGWSRPQNKRGLTVFAAYELTPATDTDIVSRVFEATGREFASELDAETRSYLASLRSEPGLMGFLFVHDLIEGERRFEGLTYSMGRRVAGEPRFRDRFDLMVEAEVGPAGSRGLTRVRAFVDPFRRPIETHPAQSFCHDTAFTEESAALFTLASELHTRWSTCRERHWRHWTSDYIDYFGPRLQPVSGTFFPTEVDQQGLRVAV